MGREGDALVGVPARANRRVTYMVVSLLMNDLLMNDDARYQGLLSTATTLSRKR